MKRLVLGVCALLSLTAGCHTIMGYEETHEKSASTGGADAGASDDSGANGGKGGADVDGSAGGSGGSTEGGPDVSTDVGPDGAAGLGGSGGASGGGGNDGGDADGAAGLGGNAGQGGVAGTAGAAGLGGSSGAAGAAGSAGSGGSGPCTPSTSVCIGNVLRVCDTSGTSWDDTPCEGATPVCDPAHAECDVCVAGTASCNGATLKICNADGTGTIDTICSSVGQCDAVHRQCSPTGSIVEIARGCNASCARLADGTVRCWGRNAYNEMSLNNTIAAYPTAVQIAGLTDVKHIAGGGTHFCATVGTDRTVKCWGKSTLQQSLGVKTVPGLSNVAELALGDRSHTSSTCLGLGFSCARLDDGTVWCWGRGADGALGDATTADRATPGIVPALSGIVQLTASVKSSLVCARGTTGSAHCWGIGVGTPVPVPLTDGATQIEATSDGKLLVVDSNGHLNEHELKGASWVINKTVDTASPPFVQLTSTLGASWCGVRGDQSCWCAGSEVFPPGEVLQVERDSISICVLTTLGNVLCWGGNNSANLGNGRYIHQRSPLPVTNLSGVVRLDLGYGATTAVMQDGSIMAWGTNPAVFGTNASRWVPEAVAEFGTGNLLLKSGCWDGVSDHCAYLLSGSGLEYLDGQQQVHSDVGLASAAFDDFAVAYPQGMSEGFDIGVRANGTVVVYAVDATANTYGIFGNDSTTSNQGDFVTVGGLANVVDFARRNYTSEHACVRTADNTVLCWGANGSGQIGTGVTGGSVLTPSVVLYNLANVEVAEVAVGAGHTCAVATDARVFCWGANGYGQLGTGDNSVYNRGALLNGLPPAKSVSCGSNHTCALLLDKTVRCWGRNDYGQLGDGTYALERTTPSADPGLTDVESLHASGNQTCAVHTNGSVSCWGYGTTGQLGAGDPISFAAPQIVVGLDP